MSQARFRYLSDKVRIIFLPFLLLAVLFPLAYSGLRWLADIRYHLLPLQEELFSFWLPFAGTIVVLLIFLRRRLLILNMTKGTAGHFILAMLVIAVTTIISQHDLSRAAYTLQQPPDLPSIAARPYNRYYSLKRYGVDSMRLGSWFSATVTGRNNEHLDFDCYLVLPMYDEGHGADPVPPAWYGVHYEKQVSNRGSDAEKEAAYSRFQAFVDSSWSREHFDSIRYFERLLHADELDGYRHAVQELQPGSSAPVVLLPVREDFSRRTGDSFGWIFGCLGIGSFLFFLSLLFTPVDTEELDRFREGHASAGDDFPDMLRFFIPHGEYFMTAMLIDLNLLWFIVMIFGGVPVAYPQGEEVIAWGGQTKELVYGGQYWRLLSATFVHFGLLHVAYNMFGLGIGGSLLEPFIGRWRFLLVYLITGVASSWIGLYFQPGGVHAGASGAIFGLYGAALGLTATKAIPREEKSGIWTVLALFAGISLVIGFFTPGIGNAAHLGGLVIGVLLGLMFGRMGWVKKPESP